ncbi:uncharacterized protein TNIN_340881 [Trichonephila inaurata madagascariensis]|uniref:Uncharacterized protein n=1 Tax=Trichonephila inaurata madagascariensis TaxID=2747483 RepID=A0A8X6XG52_9ARAC|nr:uncharacterized protein TNIN_340881 [Trichonephila inaurata madagascariensis]
MWLKILLPNQHCPLAAMAGKDGKVYFRLVDVGALLGRSKVYKFVKRFDNLVIQGKDVLPVQDSPVPNPVLVRKWVQDFMQKVQEMRQMQSQHRTPLAYQALLRVGADGKPPEGPLESRFSI